MPRVLCYQTDCLHNTDGRCRADEIEYDPVDGCLTVEPRLEVLQSDDSDEEDWGERRQPLEW